MEILCCPSCKDALYQLKSSENESESPDGFECRTCGKKYVNSEGYLDFMGDKELIHSSRREKFFRSVYAKVYTPATNFMFLFCGGVKIRRSGSDWHVTADIKMMDESLETGIGVGENLLLIARWLRISPFTLSISRNR